MWQLSTKHSCLIQNCNNYPCFYNTFPLSSNLDILFLPNLHSSSVSKSLYFEDLLHLIGGWRLISRFFSLCGKSLHCSARITIHFDQVQIQTRASRNIQFDFVRMWDVHAPTAFKMQHKNKAYSNDENQMLSSTIKDYHDQVCLILMHYNLTQILVLLFPPPRAQKSIA